MKIISWNIRGLGDSSKRLRVKKLLHQACPDVVLTQKTKFQKIDRGLIKSLWSSKDIGWENCRLIGKMFYHLYSIQHQIRRLLVVKSNLFMR